MKISVPVYLVALLASFIAAVAANYFPQFPVTADQIQWLIIVILTVFGVDVTTALKRNGLLK